MKRETPAPSLLSKSAIIQAEAKRLGVPVVSLKRRRTRAKDYLGVPTVKGGAL